MATYEDYLAQQQSLYPDVWPDRQAPEGTYWNQLGAAIPLQTQDQWSANQAREAEIAQSYANWEAANPWWQGKPGSAGAPDTYFQTQDNGSYVLDEYNRPVPMEGLTYGQAAFAHDPSFLMRNPGGVWSEGSLYGATGGGAPTLNPDGTVAYDSLAGNLSPAQQAQQAANQTVLDQQNSLAGFQLAPGSPLAIDKSGGAVGSSLTVDKFGNPVTPNVGATGGGLLGQPSPYAGTGTQNAQMPYKEMETPAGLWNGLLGTVQGSGPYTSGNMGNLSPYWNPEPYRTGWHPDAFGTGYQQLQDMMTNPPDPSPVSFAPPPVAPEVVNQYYLGTDMSGNPIWGSREDVLRYEQYTEGNGDGGTGGNAGGNNGGFGSGSHSGEEQGDPGGGWT